MLRRFDVVIAMTSPPLIAVLAALFVRIKGGALVSWIMDLNPDEAIAAGALRGNSLLAQCLARLLRFSLSTSSEVVVVDRFMLDRVVSKGVDIARVVVLPPWAHAEAVRYDAVGREQFRESHGLTGKFVVMYSGNHSPCHPLDTVLAAAPAGVRGAKSMSDSSSPAAAANSARCIDFAWRHDLRQHPVLCLISP